MKPSLFVASSVESLDIAYAVQENLEYDAEITVWPQGVFELSEYTLETLLTATAGFDFAAFVFSTDDITRIRGRDSLTIRDNVLFELGLFLGTLGRNRAFILMPRLGDKLHLPTDLIGLTPGTFEPDRKDKNLQAALGPACNKIRKAIRKHGTRREGQAKPDEALVAFHETFRSVNWNSLISRAEKQIDIVVYYFDSWVNAYHEALVQYFKKPDTRVRVVVADPRNEALLSEVVRLFPEYSRDVVREKIAHTGERFANALRIAGGDSGRLEFYYCPHALSYSVQCIDSGLLVLSVFEMHREMRIDSPAVIVDLDKSEHLRRYWEKEVKGLLAKAERADSVRSGA